METWLSFYFLSTFSIIFTIIVIHRFVPTLRIMRKMQALTPILPDASPNTPIRHHTRNFPKNLPILLLYRPATLSNPKLKSLNFIQPMNLRYTLILHDLLMHACAIPIVYFLHFSQMLQVHLLS